MSPQTEVVKVHPESLFEYYKRQGVIVEEDIEHLLHGERDSVPLTFRLSLNSPYCYSITQKFASILQLERLLLSQESADSASYQLRSLSRYPGKGAYQVVRPKGNLRHMLSKWVARASEVGVITLQDAASMVPPLLLKIQSHFKVLDLCAAPGSKTFQLIEMLHQTNKSRNPPAGFVVANDASVKRLSILTHQLKRANSPSVVVTNHLAEEFPLIYLPKQNQTQSRRGAQHELLQFDAILADVPCSCDGKTKIWSRYSKTPSVWFKNHSMQLKITLRGARLLKVGGRLVYSTRSLNPIENEAVIAALLTRSRGALHLVDISAELEELEKKPGLCTWDVCDEVFSRHSNHDGHDEVPESAWPPSPSQNKTLRLERCLRIMQHHDNMGALFVAVLYKSAELPVDFESICAHVPNGVESNSCEDPGNPCCFRRVTDSRLINSILKAYGIMDDTRFRFKTGFLSRTDGQNERKNPKRLYYASKEVVDFIFKSVVAGLFRLNVFAVGVLLFERQASNESSSDYRLTQGGLLVTFPHLTRRVVHVTPLELEALLCRHQGEALSKKAAKSMTTREADVPLGIWEMKSAMALQNVEAGCVIIAAGFPMYVDTLSKPRNLEVDSNLIHGTAAGFHTATTSSSNHVALACWYGNGTKGRSLSILASKAECSIILYHLRLSLANTKVPS